MKEIFLPITNEQIDNLQIGELVYLSGVIYSARDNTHKRIIEILEREGNLSSLGFSLSSFYYMGPTPARVGVVCGSAGPTTSARMDRYTPALLEKGLKVMIGKGNRSNEVKKSIKENHAIYFSTLGGAGAYLADKIKKMECVAFPELGPEAVYKLQIEDFPVVVNWK
jgi:fumarate hydratase subunit beta